MGKPGFPNPLPVGAPAAPNRGWDMGKPGFPNPLPVGAPAAPTSGWDMGKPGFPIPLPGVQNLALRTLIYAVGQYKEFAS